MGGFQTEAFKKKTHHLIKIVDSNFIDFLGEAGLYC